MGSIAKARTPLAREMLKWLIDKGLTCSDFAREVGISESYFSRWMNGKVPMPKKQTEKIAGAGVPEHIMEGLRRENYVPKKCRECHYHPNNCSDKEVAS